MDTATLIRAVAGALAIVLLCVIVWRRKKRSSFVAH
jgi:hypothetical protein